MACVRLLTKPRASRLGRYPSLPAIVVTRSRTSMVILGSFFNARETVAAEMSNALAMSLMVTLPEMEANGGFTAKIQVSLCVQTLAQKWRLTSSSMTHLLGGGDDFPTFAQT